MEPVLCMQTHALNPDLQPKSLSSSILNHKESWALSLDGKYKANHHDSYVQNTWVFNIRNGWDTG